MKKLLKQAYHPEQVLVQEEASQLYRQLKQKFMNLKAKQTASKMQTADCRRHRSTKTGTWQPRRQAAEQRPAFGRSGRLSRN